MLCTFIVMGLKTFCILFENLFLISPERSKCPCILFWVGPGLALLIIKQTGGKKKKKTEGKGGGERDLWTTRSENEALIRLLKFEWLFR